MENFQNADFGEEIISWQVPEYEKHDRTKKWYITAIIIAIGFLVFSIYSNNPLFSFIIIMASAVIFIHDTKEPAKVQFSITDEGVLIGKKFYDYDEFKDFSIIYKPNYNIKNLYFEFKNPLKQRLSIPLLDMNPLPIRENLLKYLTEDLERTNQPLSEGLAKLFKL